MVLTLAERAEGCWATAHHDALRPGTQDPRPSPELQPARRWPGRTSPARRVVGHRRVVVQDLGGAGEDDDVVAAVAVEVDRATAVGGGPIRDHFARHRL